MKSYILLVVLAAIICFIAGCGPGHPFEIEEHFACQTQAHVQVSTAE